MDNATKNKIVLRSIAAALAAIPLAYFADFYEHFYLYLTGTIITDVIRNEWHIVFISIAVSMAFFLLLSFRRRVKWVEYGIVGAFFISLFVEMYGIPLSITLASKYFLKPGIEAPKNILEFNFLGVGFGADIAMTYGMILIVIGMILIMSGWIALYYGAKKNGIAIDGIYSFSRHPQYLGFILFITGWFFGWPTILTALFAPVMVYKYVRLSKLEEDEIMIEYPSYGDYKKKVPFFI